jgi:hypothetical protein
LNFTGFSEGTEEEDEEEEEEDEELFIKSSLIAAIGNLADFLNFTTFLFPKGTKTGLIKNLPFFY